MNEKVPILQMKELFIEYANENGNKRTIVENGEFEIYSGEIVLIVGENGCGKSSILRAIVGDSNKHFLLSLKNGIKKMFKKNKTTIKDSHSLFFMGEKIDDIVKHDAFKRQIGYSRQEDDVDAFYERKVWNYVLDYASHSDGMDCLSTSDLGNKVQEVYDSLHCEKYCEGKLKKMRLKNCSGGEKKMVSILSALSRINSKLFIFDEPINNLDAYHARRLNNYLVDLKNKPNAPGILIITHCPIFTNVDRIYELKKGKLCIKQRQDYETKTCFGMCDLANGKYLEEE